MSECSITLCCMGIGFVIGSLLYLCIDAIIEKIRYKKK